MSQFPQQLCHHWWPQLTAIQESCHSSYLTIYQGTEDMHATLIINLNQ